MAAELFEVCGVLDGVWISVVRGFWEYCNIRWQRKKRMESVLEFTRLAGIWQWKYSEKGVYHFLDVFSLLRDE